MPNTVTLGYSERGQGSPVVFLHGYPLNREIWREQLQSLSDHYRVITPDLRGHGQSPVPDGVYEMESLARDVFTLLDSLEVPQAVMIGHSMGGYATLAAWRLAPERFIALGLVGSQAGADSDEARQTRFNTAEKVFVEGSKIVADAMTPKLFAPGFPKDDPIVEQVRNIILSTKPTGIIGALKGMAARPDSSQLLPGITVPVLLLTGDKDQLIPSQRSEIMAADIKIGSLVTVENAGHLPMMEQPHATTMAIRKFLDEVIPS